MVTLRREPILVSICTALLVGCAGQPPAVASARLRLDVQRAEGELGRLRQERVRLQRQIEEDLRATAEVRDRANRAETQLRVQSQELKRVVATLQAAEEDLAAARKRKQAIDAELGVIKAAEAELQTKNQKFEAIKKAIPEVENQVRSAQAQLDERQAAVAARVKELQTRIAGIDVLDATIREALAKIVEQAGPFQPVPIPAGAGTKPPAGKVPENKSGAGAKKDAPKKAPDDKGDPKKGAGKKG